MCGPCFPFPSETLVLETLSWLSWGLAPLMSAHSIQACTYPHCRSPLGLGLHRLQLKNSSPLSLAKEPVFSEDVREWLLSVGLATMSQLSPKGVGLVSLVNGWELVPRLAFRYHVGSMRNSQAGESTTPLSR